MDVASPSEEKSDLYPRRKLEDFIAIMLISILYVKINRPQ